MVVVGNYYIILGFCIENEFLNWLFVFICRIIEFLLMGCFKIVFGLFYVNFEEYFEFVKVNFIVSDY